MIVFADTSALLAVLDADEDNHDRAAARWKTLLKGDDILLTHNYVLVETLALIQSRLGMSAVTAFVEDLLPVISIRWVDDTTHKAALAALLTANRRQMSFVDCVSFQIMRELGIKAAFTLDSHFKQQGFRILK
ncbi:MAG: PIN domain-containing protein [Actinomycetota bacterium]